MSQDQRFTCWLSDEEREGLEEKASEMHSSINFVVRVAIRQFLDLHSRPRLGLGDPPKSA